MRETLSPEVAGDRRLSNPTVLNQYSRPGVIVRRAPGQPAHTNAMPVEFDILFDKPVIDFPIGINTGGIVFTGSAAGLYYEVAGARDTYRVTIRHAERDGDLALAVPPGLAADLFGNVNTPSSGEDAIVWLDMTRPHCVFQSDQEGVMNDAQMNITLAFSEPVYGLRDDALALENATLTRAGGADGDTHYHFVVTPRADGVTALTLPEDSVVDAAGNGNVASPVFSLIVDSTGPEVTLSSFETPRASNSWVMRIQAVFNEPVLSFERDDVSLQGGALMNFTARDGGRVYLFDVRPTEGTVRVLIPAGVAHDLIGNPNSASEVFVREIDRTRPSVEFAVHREAGRGGEGVPVDVIFSEPVFGFDPGALNVSRGSARWLSGGDGDAVYRYLVTPSGTRAVELRIAAGAAADLAGNPNRAASTRFTPPAFAPARPGEGDGRAAPPLID